MNRGIIPTVIGMNPPNKEVIIARTRKPDGHYGDGFDLWIFSAEFPDGTPRGEFKSDNFDELRGLQDWIKFCNADVMEQFGMDLVRFARSHKPKETKSKKIVHCDVCDNAIFADMKYCDRCGAKQDGTKSR